MKSMTLDAVEFIRRFLLHILPLGFVNIRHFGFLANRNPAAALALCRDLLKPSADRSVSILPPLSNVLPSSAVAHFVTLACFELCNGSHPTRYRAVSQIARQ
jgi:Putative transposase